MITLALVPFALGILTALSAPWLARRLAPALATVTLTALALTISLAGGLMLSLAAYVAASEVLPLPQFRDRSITVLRDSLPLPPALGFAAGALSALLLGRALLHLVRVAVSLRRTALAADALPTVGELAVVADDAVHAYAVPGYGVPASAVAGLTGLAGLAGRTGLAGRRGRIVVSTGLLRALSAQQRRALLAHERAHLRCRHHLFVQAAQLAAAANPTLRPVADAVALGTERWADAAAARVVGDRVVVARALAAAALAPRPAAPSVALAAAGADTVVRVRSLLEPPRRRAPLGAGLLAASVLCWVCAAAVLLHVHDIIEVAEAAHR